ncbi:DNA replication complex GINS protein SLD5 [Panicum miliaceum]|uniref:DNA replication complex GINS protein SLD5 n=1 Tax=Panicum miliaceum TaxID=4540 RepID=A0A3L6RDX7_PANMI|nr:DNA replication complex GINS protein SLD5 [Panicum miliaceum]
MEQEAVQREGQEGKKSSWDDDESTAASAAEAATTDVELLRRAWRNEKAAPEILRFDTPLVSRVREQVQLLEETLDDFADTGVDDLVVSLYQMDLDRTLFLLRSYLRLRLQKIEKYTMHISRSDDLRSRLSPQERRCAEIMEKHLEQSVLSKLPYGYDSVTRHSLSSTEDDMVPEPQLDTFVFCKTKSDVGAFQLDDIGEEVVDLVADDLYVLSVQVHQGPCRGWLDRPYLM